MIEIEPPVFGSSARAETPLLIAFTDLTRFAAQSLCNTDEQLADTLDAFYQRVTARIEAAGGRVVKFIGDAGLIVFPSSHADRGVQALLDLKAEIDDWLETIGWASRLMIKVHFGPAVAGPFGVAGGARFDVIGRAVNIAAMLDSTGVALSADAFRKLGAETRKRFKKHTPTVTYIRVEDPHGFRRRS